MYMKRTVALFSRHSRDIAAVDLCPFAVYKSLYSVGVFLACLCAGNAYRALCRLGDERQLAVRGLYILFVL